MTVSIEGRAVGAVIERRMRAANLNRSKLAERAGVNRSTVGRLINGERMGVEALGKVAEALGTTTTVIRKEAGVLTPAEKQHLHKRVRFEDYIRDDPYLLPRQREYLIGIYRDLVAGAVGSVHSRDRAE